MFCSTSLLTLLAFTGLVAPVDRLVAFAKPAPAGSTAPSPTQPGITSQCNAYYEVKSGDTCNAIVSKYGTFTLSTFFSWNPSVGSDCSKLLLGYYVCVGVSGTTTKKTSTTTPAASPAPSPTQSGLISSCNKFYQVKSGDYCQTIVSLYGTFTLSQFISWNPAVGSDCRSLLAGYYVCVGISSTQPTTKTTSTTTRAATTTAAGTVPSPTQTGIAANCNSYYQAVSGDTCSIIASRYGTFSVAQFEAWNPAVGSNCGSLLLGYWYCVGVGSTSTTKPSPLMSGTASNCNKYYQVQSGDTCAIIESTQHLTSAQFLGWNTGINQGCSNLWLGYYVCIGV